AGILPDALARRAGRVIAVEKDPALVTRLKARFHDRPNVEIRHADILAHPLPRAAYVVFASPPFDATSAIVRKLTSAAAPPRDAYLVLQREAADRYLGRPRQTLAGLLIAPWFSVRIIHRFARSDFVPSAAVDVVVVSMRTRGPLPRDAARLAATSSIRFSLLFHRDFARIRSRRSGKDLDPHRLHGLEVWIAFLKTIPSVPRISRSR